MKDFLNAAKFLLLDLASTIFFLILFLVTHNMILSVVLGTALGVFQIAIPLVQRKPVHSLEWMSLFLVIAAGTATILTNDPRVMLLKAGWIIRYLPPIAKAAAPDVAVVVGYTWAAVMFLTAAVNALVAVTYSVQTWATFMLIFGVVSKVAVFIVGFLAIRLTTVRRIRAMSSEKREALLASTGV
jgi:intracellular septation protein